MSNTAVVTTTIRFPENLLAIQRNAKHYGHHITVVVAGDDKTPPEAFEGPWVYMSPEQQEDQFPELHIPRNCDARRNYALLWAYRVGFDTIITVDDDNWPQMGDFIGQHRVGHKHQRNLKTNYSGWVNVTDGYYPRGFPVEQRNPAQYPVDVNGFFHQRRVVVNAGLWAVDPDIDAVTRLALGPVQSTLGDVKPFALLNAWCPFNSQNTALHRDVIPAYFLDPEWGRFGDIWASYVVQRIAEHLGDLIVFGPPIVQHIRNPHDVWNDLEQELPYMKLTASFIDKLQAVTLRGATYCDCFGELIQTRGMEAWHKQFAPVHA